MMFIGQKICLWKYFAQTFQFLVETQFVLTVTEIHDDGKHLGTLEDGSVYRFENGSWWAVSDEGETKLDMAMHLWNTAMQSRKDGMRVILLSDGKSVEPSGDVKKCEKHNRYFLSGSSCFGCRTEASARTAPSLTP